MIIPAGTQSSQLRLIGFCLCCAAKREFKACKVHGNKMLDTWMHESMVSGTYPNASINMHSKKKIILGSPNVYPFLLKVFAVHVLLTSHRGHVQATVGSSVGKLVVDSSVGSWVVDSSVGSLVPGCSVLFGQSLLTSLPWQGSSSIRTNSHRVAITHST